MPRLHSFFLLLTGLALAAALCAAPSRAADEAAPVMSLEAGPFRAADVVLLATVRHVTDVRAPGGALGRQIARFTVDKVYKGDVAAGTALSVVVHGQRPTLDPARPSTPYFRANVEERFVLFLARTPGGVTYRMQTLFDTSDKTGPEKVAAVEAVAAVAAIPHAGAKARRALEVLLEMIRSPRGWTRTFAARELAWLGAAQPRVFTAKTEARLRRLSRARMTTDQRFWLRRLFRALEAARAKDGAAARPPAAAEADPWRRTWTDAATSEGRRTLLARLLRADPEGFERHGWWAYQQSEPSLKRWLLRALGDPAIPVGAGSLQGLYPAEEDPEVREELVRTLGLRGSSAAVPWLEDRSRNLALRRPALLALARIRDPEALAALTRRRDAALKDGEVDLAAWIEHLLSPAFEAAERRAGRTPGPR